MENRSIHASLFEFYRAYKYGLYQRTSKKEKKFSALNFNILILKHFQKRLEKKNYVQISISIHRRALN